MQILSLHFVGHKTQNRSSNCSLPALHVDICNIISTTHLLHCLACALVQVHAGASSYLSIIRWVHQLGLKVYLAGCKQWVPFHLQPVPCTSKFKTRNGISAGVSLWDSVMIFASVSHCTLGNYFSVIRSLTLTRGVNIASYSKGLLLPHALCYHQSPACYRRSRHLTCCWKFCFMPQRITWPSSS
jgi:hypothetical protein